MRATVISVRFDVNEEKNGKTYSFFKLQYMTERKENKVYTGMMSYLKFNKALEAKLKGMKPDDEVNLIMGKNKFGYDELQGAEFIDKPQVVEVIKEVPAKASGYNNRDFETKEERQQKQVYIVRQSSISSAIDLLKTDKKAPNVLEVLDVARQFEQYVFGRLEDKEMAANRVDAHLVDDLPFDVDDVPM